MNSHKPNGFFSDSFIYILQNILYVSDLFTYIRIVKYMINKSLNQKCKLFDTLVASVLNYSSDLWGMHEAKDIEIIHIKNC